MDGQFYTDPLHRHLYATDASHYEELPAAVALPAHARDCQRLVEHAVAQSSALIPRGGGTGLCGQTVGSGMVVDVSRHMHTVEAIDAAAGSARVQPGVVPAHLNALAARDGLRFAPDPSTLDRCTIGGMHGNNAWGSHAPRDGSTRDHVIAADLITGEGTLLHCAPLSAAGLASKLVLAGTEGDIYRCIHGLIDTHRELILDRSPHPEVTNNTGYALDVLARGQPWEPRGLPFNLTRLLCGAEGTLGLITGYEVALVPVEAARGLLCLHFDTLDNAVAAVPGLMALSPAALELLDDGLLRLTADQPEQRANRFWVEGRPGGVLVTEFSGDNDQVRERLAACRETAAGLTGLYAAPEIAGGGIDRVFALRRAALGLLMGRPGAKRTATVIEDSAVPLAALSDYLVEVRALMHRLEVDCMYYGSLSRGLVHLRPWLDLDDAADRRKFEALPEALSELVHRYRGAFSTKHGDGRLRAPWLETMYGSEMVALFRTLKRGFDPHGLFNPGKILDSPAMATHLRRGGTGLSATGLRWSAGLLRAASQCSGAGVCRKSGGAMCPSYMATRDETHVTRGRANLLRAALTAPNPAAALAGADLDEVMSLCLSCKACRHECPANVDMARLKAEWLYQRQRSRNIDLAARIVGNYAKLSAVATRLPALSNALLRRAWFKRALDIDPRRELPALARRRFSRWLAGQPGPEGDEDVILVIDPHTEYYEPAIGRAGLSLLRQLGLRVHVTPCLPSGRAEISQGLLPQASARVTALVETIRAMALPADTPIIGLEPSELFTLRDEAEDLGAAETVRLPARSVTLDEFLLAHLRADDDLRRRFAGGDRRQAVLVHTHCHQKALGDRHATRDLLRLLGWRAHTIDSPCCGMAGFFGYRYYDTSMAVAGLALAPALRAAANGTAVISNGLSCRQQIAHIHGPASHVAEFLHRHCGAVTAAG